MIKSIVFNTIFFYFEYYFIKGDYNEKINNNITINVIVYKWG